MRIQLAKTLDGIGFYGPIYDLGTGVPDKVEEYVMEDNEHDWLLEKMIDRINAECDTLLDDGDYDFIDAGKCKRLIELVDNLPKDYVPEQYKRVVGVLKEYASRAIEYNTGMAIEM